MTANGGAAAGERQKKWDLRFMGMARLVALNSKDRKARVGCVLADARMAVLATGYNGFPRGVDDGVDARHGRPAKYLYTVHAEANAVADAACRGASLAGATAYVPWFPCAQCAGLLVQAGVAAVAAYRPDLSDPRWGADHRAALERLGEAGVVVRYLEGERIGAGAVDRTAGVGMVPEPAEEGEP